MRDGRLRQDDQGQDDEGPSIKAGRSGADGGGVSWLGRCLVGGRTISEGDLLLAQSDANV